MRPPGTAFANAALRLLDRLEDAVCDGGVPEKRLALVIFGGVAVHFYTAHRVSSDLDIDFLGRRIQPGQDISISYKEAEGDTRVVTLDRQYSNTLGLLQEGYLDRIVPIEGWRGRLFDAYLAAPVDLAISKLGRFAGHDQQDIAELASAGLIDKQEFIRLAEDAISMCIGNAALLRLNLRDALASFPSHPERKDKG